MTPYDGEMTVRFGDEMFAVPIAELWGGRVACAHERVTYSALSERAGTSS